MSSNHERNEPTANDLRFLRALRAELYRQAVEYARRKNGTAEQTLFIATPPLMFGFFESEV